MRHRLERGPQLVNIVNPLPPNNAGFRHNPSNNHLAEFGLRKSNRCRSLQLWQAKNDRQCRRYISTAARLIGCFCRWAFNSNHFTCFEPFLRSRLSAPAPASTSRLTASDREGRSSCRRRQSSSVFRKSGDTRNLKVRCLSQSDSFSLMPCSPLAVCGTCSHMTTCRPPDSRCQWRRCWQRGEAQTALFFHSLRKESERRETETRPTATEGSSNEPEIRDHDSPDLAH